MITTLMHGGPGDDIILYAGDVVNETGIYVDLNNSICQFPSAWS